MPEIKSVLLLSDYTDQLLKKASSPTFGEKLTQKYDATTGGIVNQQINEFVFTRNAYLDGGSLWKAYDAALKSYKIGVRNASGTEKLYWSIANASAGELSWTELMILTIAGQLQLPIATSSILFGGDAGIGQISSNVVGTLSGDSFYVQGGDLLVGNLYNVRVRSNASYIDFGNGSAFDVEIHRASATALETNANFKFTNATQGIVLKDRTAGTYHRVYLDSGALAIEAE